VRWLNMGVFGTTVVVAASAVAVLVKLIHW
jgi:hypothetical protein